LPSQRNRRSSWRSSRTPGPRIRGSGSELTTVAPGRRFRPAPSPADTGQIGDQRCGRVPPVRSCVSTGRRAEHPGGRLASHDAPCRPPRGHSRASLPRSMPPRHRSRSARPAGLRGSYRPPTRRRRAVARAAVVVAGRRVGHAGRPVRAAMLKQISPNGTVRSTARRVRLRASPRPGSVGRRRRPARFSPPRRVAGHQIFGGRCEIGGHQRKPIPAIVTTASAGFIVAHQNDPDGLVAERSVPQAG
jgi:hypothetical protein